MSESQQASSDVRVLSHGLGSALCEFFGRAQYHATIIAPFIRAPALRRVLHGLDPEVQLTVVTRWRVEEILSGASDTDVWDVVMSHEQAQLFLNPRLHAKLYSFDYAEVIVGSANVTHSALWASKEPNIEVLLASEATTSHLLLIREVVEHSFLATIEYRKEIDIAVEKARERASFPHFETPAAPSHLYNTSSFFPKIRTPERLFVAFLDLHSLPMHQIPDAVSDLVALGPQLPGASKEAFDEAVSNRLWETSLVQQVYDIVETPKRFGELTEWLKRHLAPMAHLNDQHVQRRLQTLLRWLIYFLPEKFRLERPNHTEVLSRRS